jgi:hypothetical protein
VRVIAHVRLPKGDHSLRVSAKVLVNVGETSPHGDERLIEVSAKVNGPLERI